MKKVVEPQFESRDDFDVFADMAELLNAGGREVFTEGKNEMEWLRGFYDEAQQAARNLRIRMPRFNQFWEKNELIEMRYSNSNAKFVRYSSYRKDPVMNALGTPSGKIEIFSRTIEGFGYEDCPAHPTWLEPDEWVGTARQDELQLMTAHPAHRLHSQLNYAKLREEYAIADREPITINTEDAETRGIKTGDLVRAFNDRGECLVGALVTDGIRKGAVCIHEGAWPDFDKPYSICKNGSANLLTPDIPTSRLANGCAANSALVKIEKYNGAALRLTAFTPPAGA